jgi:ATPase subunit of ABC transporter with duplicated ATPase domains
VAGLEWLRLPSSYRGALLVVSHDARFLEDVGVDRHLRVTPR